MTEATVPTYSLAERDRRWNMARSFMDDHDVAALLVFGEHEDAGPAPYCFDNWFTNDRPGAIVVLPREGEPLSIVWHLYDQTESWSRGETLWIAQENYRIGLDSGGVVAALNELGLTTATIGVAGLEPYRPFLPEGVVPYRLWTSVTEQLPDAVFKPLSPPLLWMLAELGEQEIAAVRHSASIGDAMARAMVDVAGPGVSESEVFAAGMAAAHSRGTAVPWMHLWSGPEPLGFGPPSWIYRPQAPRILQEGDVINTEVFCNFGMRSTQHLATIAIGEVHADFDRLEAIARESYAAGLAALRAGSTFGAVADEMRKAPEKAGGLRGYPVVHSINPFGATGGGMPTSNPDLELKPGMTFVFEPRCAFGRRVVTVGGTVIVGKNEAIELNPYTARMLRA